MPRLDAQALIAGQIVAVMAAGGVLLWLMAAKNKHSPSWWFQNPTLTTLNMTFASISFLALTLCQALIAHRFLEARRSGRRW